MANKPVLPTIVTTDDSNTPSETIHPPEPAHTRSPSDPTYLSPQPAIAPAPSSTGASSSVPPSPTFSNHSSVHWQDSRALRQNEVDGGPNGGMTSLLEPGNAKHGRKASVTSYTSTVPDEKPSTLSPTQTGTTAAATLISDKKKSKKAGDDAEDAAPNHIDPSLDETDPTPFEQKPLVLASLVDPKSLASLEAMGGCEGLLRGIGTDTNLGLRSWQYTDSGQRSDPEGGNGGGAGAGGDSPITRASVEDRKRVYGVNQMPSRKSKSLLLLMWLALKDKVLVLLSIAAVVSLALGLYSDFGTTHEPILCDDGITRTCQAPKVDWVEGVAIMIAILIVVIVGSLNDWQKERQFRKLNDKKEDRGVKVVRDGNEQVINVKDVLVGDIALLEPGEIIPCDGVFLRGHNVRCDESGATGESDAIKKVTYEECMEEARNLKPGEKAKLDCFIVSGSKVLEGVGQYVIIAIGPKSFNGRIMAALSGDTESTPLQLKLNALAELIAKLGSAAGLILFSALMIKFFVQLKTKSERSANEKAMSFVQILIISVTLIVVAVPEGLPLAVTLALAFATKRMTKERLLVRVLGSCETMANASVVCTDKTGTLTQNVMSVVAGSVGIHCKFVQHLSENEGRQNVDRVLEDHDVGSERNKSHKDDFPLEMSELNTVVQDPLRSMFNEAIAINSTAFEDKNPETGELEFVGSKTETALLRFAKDLKWAPYQQTRHGAEVVQMIPFSSERKAMGVVVRTTDGKYRLYLKGASEILTKMCKRHVVVRRPGSQSPDVKEVETAPITELEEENISRTIIFYANQMLRTLAVAYRDFEQWPPAGHTGAIDEVPYEMIANELTLIGIVGIEDPLRPGVKEAVQKCHGAGVTIKMCTGDNVLTARSIASQCGIFTAGGIIMEGPVFRRLSPEEQREIVPRLQVLARSSPEDKRILVDTLKGLGEIVGVTGDGTNDGPALKHANVGFSMGIAGTEIAKEASDIILMDDNFSSIVSAIMWGRCVNDAVRKFLQFQVSVNITAVLITFISAVSSDEEESVLTAVQLLWINIIMDTFAALALATDPASPEMLNRMPDRKTAPLFSVDMGKMIIGQSMYQTFIVLLFHFAGTKFWGYTTEKETSELSTMVFNTFVFCQIFNSINCRSLTQDKNIFRGLSKNWYFVGITLIEVAIQILIVFFGGAAFQVTSMNGRDWGMSIALGFVSIPLGFLIRCIPTPPVERLFVALRIMRDPNAPPKLTKAEKKEEAERKREEEKERWNPAINQVRDRLEMFSNIRGARMRSSSFVRKSRSQRANEQEESDIGVIPSLMAMVPTLVMSSVGAGWAPQPGKLEDPAGTDPSKSSSALWQGQIQIHPDTKPDDIVRKWGKESV